MNKEAQIKEIADIILPIGNKTWVSPLIARGIAEELYADGYRKEADIRKDERDKIIRWLDERVMCEHLAYYHRRRYCDGCWQALKKGGVDD